MVIETKDAIEKIKKRPLAYLSEYSLDHFCSFLGGIAYVEQKMNPNQISCDELMMEFREWLADKFSISSGQSWSQIICFYSGSQYQALDNFFSEWDEFMKQKG